MRKQDDVRHELFERLGVRYRYDDSSDEWFTAIRKMKKKTSIYRFKDLRDAQDFLRQENLPSDPFGPIEVMDVKEFMEMIEQRKWRGCEIGECLMDDGEGPWPELCQECLND